MNIKNLNSSQLNQYICDQLNHLFPDPYKILPIQIKPHLDEALERIIVCINSVKAWPNDSFDYLHSSQYCQFLYYLSNTLWSKTKNENLCTKLFYLNKTLNGFECFYDNSLPDKFFIGHSSGIVLVRNTYSNYLVLYQGATVGKNHDATPILGEGVVLYPHSSVIGRCNIGDRSVISQGTRVINQDTPGNCYVFNQNKKLAFNTPSRDIISNIFHID